MDDFMHWIGEQQNIPDILYHVTMIRNLPKIKKFGLRPNQPAAFKAGAYPAYSKGKVFLTDFNGVSYWKHKIEYVEFDAFDDHLGVAVITVKVGGLNLVKDELGSTDSRRDAYYTTSPIAPERITNIQEFPAEDYE